MVAGPRPAQAARGDIHPRPALDLRDAGADPGAAGAPDPGHRPRGRQRRAGPARGQQARRRPRPRFGAGARAGQRACPVRLVSLVSDRCRRKGARPPSQLRRAGVHHATSHTFSAALPRAAARGPGAGRVEVDAKPRLVSLLAAPLGRRDAAPVSAAALLHVDEIAQAPNARAPDGPGRDDRSRATASRATSRARTRMGSRCASTRSTACRAAPIAR